VNWLMHHLLFVREMICGRWKIVPHHLLFWFFKPKKSKFIWPWKDKFWLKNKRGWWGTVCMSSLCVKGKSNAINHTSIRLLFYSAITTVLIYLFNLSLIYARNKDWFTLSYKHWWNRSALMLKTTLLFHYYSPCANATIPSMLYCLYQNYF
jgi:hypothetical protein